MDSSFAAPLLVDLSADNPSESPTQQMSSLFKAAVAAAVTPMFLFGYNTGVMNAPESVIFPSHSVLQWSVAVSAFCAGGFFGANVSGYMADVFGRRRCLIIILFLNLLFGLAHVVAPDILFLIGARFGIGLAGGASTVLTPMYLSEISPNDIRGSIGTLTQLSCVLGILASVLWTIPFCTLQKWRLIFIPIPIIAIVGILASIFLLPESPRWLLLKHYVTRGYEARETIRRFRNLTDGDEEVVEMEVLIALGGTRAQATRTLVQYGDDGVAMNQENSPENFNQSAINREENKTFYSFICDPRNRIPLASSILFPVAQQLSGINAVFYYSTSFFEGVIPNPQTGTIVAFSVNVVATIVALLLMDRFGRKTLLSWSAGGMFVCCILLTLSLKGIIPGFCTVLAVMMYISFFEIGLGCIPFFLASEMIDPEFLGTVQSLIMSLNWFFNFCVGIFFPYMDRYLGPYSFVPFAVVLFGTVIYSILVLPETRGKSQGVVMQEIDNRAGRNDTVYEFTRALDNSTEEVNIIT